jgi:hypothetical protein
MGTLVLTRATSGSATLTPVDAVTAVITLPSATATLATLGANTFTGTQTLTGGGSGGLILGYGGISTYGAIWSNQVSPSTSNYALFARADTTQINVPTGGAIYLGINSNTTLQVNATGAAVTGTLSATGQVTSNGSTNDVAFIAQDSGSLTGFRANSTGAGGRNYGLFSTANASGLGGGNFAIYDGTAGAARMLITSTGLFRVQGAYDTTTTNPANVQIDGNAQLNRVTSALKYKQDIRDLELIDVNRFRPVRYKSKCPKDDQTLDHFGIIADEVDAEGITELVTYGNDGEVEAFAYERLTVVLLKAVQDLTARLAALEAK